MTSQRWAWAHIDRDALRHNVHALAQHVAPQQLWAVVKADAYGHGAVECAQAALNAGAQGLCVALVDEGVALRNAGISVPILVMSEQPTEQYSEIVAYGLITTVYNESSIAELSRVAQQSEVMTAVHLKVDTGMHRVGVDPQRAVDAAKQIAAAQWLTLDGVYTHCATADATDATFAEQQISRFAHVVSEIRTAGIAVQHVHVSNSAAAIRHLDSQVQCTLARVGIALYGIAGDAESNSFGADHQLELRPVMSLCARVSHVQRVKAGEGVSYGLRRPVERDSIIATIPLGYADGVPRGLWETGAVLIGGKRRQFAGVITMDQLMVNCDNDEIAIGDEVVLIGAQGSDAITANEWARHMGTIGYEIVCGISARVPRRYIN